MNVLARAFASLSLCTLACSESTDAPAVHVDATADSASAADAGRSIDAGHVYNLDGALPPPAADGATPVVNGPFGPLPPQNPYAAGSGFATQHGDTSASDSSPLPGPGLGALTVQNTPLLAACPSVFVADDGATLAVCTQIANQTPAVFLLDAAGTTSSGSLPLTKGNLFGGVYPYLDQNGQLVIVDGSQNLLHVGHHRNGASWVLSFEDSTSLGDVLGDGNDDGVVGLIPDYDGNIWFASAEGTVGFVDPRTRTVATAALPQGEIIANSISSAPEGVAVVSDHALYVFGIDDQGRPTVRSRAAYDRGTARKPGQLSQGSGSTPTFFGPATGTEYLAITDNASPTMNLLVFSSRDPKEPLCTLSLPSPAGLGSENSPVGSGRSVFVTSTYGYPYAATPSNAAASVPGSAPFLGGMTRIDVSLDETRCEVAWTNAVRSAAVPKLSLGDGLLYTFTREPGATDTTTSAFDRYAFVAIDPATGDVLSKQELPSTSDTMQLSGTIAKDGAFLQGTILGLVRIQP